MTACFTLMKAFQSEQYRPVDPSFCTPCVYFSGNIDSAKLQSDNSPAQPDRCSLDFMPGDSDCAEMRTNNCSARKNKV